MGIDQQVEEFSGELEKGIDWYELDVSQLSNEQLLKTMHRHVTMLNVHGRNKILYRQYLSMLSSVVDELERRRLALQHLLK